MDVDGGTVPVAELVAAVKVAVREANISDDNLDRDVHVATMGLTLHAMAIVKAGGGLDFRIPVIGWKVKFGAHHTAQRTHTIEIGFIPRDAKRFEVRGGQVEQSLLDAISTIRAAIAVAGAGDDPFELDTATITLMFAVTDQGSISVGAEGELTDEFAHTLTLGLEPA